MRTWLSVGLAAVLMASLAHVTVGSASAVGVAGDGTILPIDRFADLAVDPARNIAYVAGGLADGKVLVVDASGSVVRTFDDLPNPDAVTLSEDGSTLFVSLVQEPVIVGIDTTTGQRTRYPLGVEADCHGDLATAAGLVWFIQCVGDFPSRLGALDPLTGVVQDSLGPDFGPERLASDPAVPGALFVAYSSQLIRFDVRTREAGNLDLTRRASRDFSANAGTELAISPDGRQILDSGLVLDAKELRTVDSYVVDRYPVAYAYRQDGMVAVGDNDYEVGDDLFVYGPGKTVFADRTDYGTADTSMPREVARHGLGFGPTTLFAVTVSTYGNIVSIRTSEPKPHADPVGSNRLPLKAFYQVIADPRHHQAFISSGPISNGVVVVDTAGRSTRVLQHMPGASRMVLAGSTLYVALADGDAVAAVNTRTFAVRRYHTGNDSAPESVGVSAGLVWFATRAHGSIQHYSLGAINPATGVVHSDVFAGVARDLRASPFHPGELFAMGPEQAGVPDSPLTRIRVHGGRHPSARVQGAAQVGYGVEDFALTPDRLHVTVASAFGFSFGDIVVTARSMALAGLAYFDQTPIAVAVRTDGLVAGGYGSLEEPSTPGPNLGDIALRYGALGPTAAVFRFPNSDKDGSLLVRGLAFGTRNLYAVNGVEGNFVVHVLQMPSRRPVTVATDKAGYPRNGVVRVVAHVDPRRLGKHPHVTLSYRRGGATHRLRSNRAPDRFGNVSVTTRFHGRSTFIATVRIGHHTWRTELERRLPVSIAGARGNHGGPVAP